MCSLLLCMFISSFFALNAKKSQFKLPAFITRSLFTSVAMATYHIFFPIRSFSQPFLRFSWVIFPSLALFLVFGRQSCWPAAVSVIFMLQSIAEYLFKVHIDFSSRYCICTAVTSISVRNL